jgi:hypothetical protein
VVGDDEGGVFERVEQQHGREQLLVRQQRLVDIKMMTRQNDDVRMMMSDRLVSDRWFQNENVRTVMSE